jgi:hypothetical protein
MNQQQLLVLYLPLLSPLATLAIVMVGFLYNNSRLSDFRLSMGDMRDMLRAEIKVLQATMEKNQSELLSKFAELETRVTRIEEKIH